MLPYSAVRTVVFLLTGMHICTEKPYIAMFRRYADPWQYEKFAACLLDEKPYLDPSVTFRGLCHGLGLPYRRLNNTLLAELGLGGQEIMEIFREGDVRKLLFLQF